MFSRAGLWRCVRFWVGYVNVVCLPRRTFSAKVSTAPSWLSFLTGASIHRRRSLVVRKEIVLVVDSAHLPVCAFHFSVWRSNIAQVSIVQTTASVLQPSRLERAVLDIMYAVPASLRTGTRSASAQPDRTARRWPK